MGKVLKFAAGVVGIAALVIPGVGAAISGAIFGALGGLAGGTIGAIALGVAQTVTAGLMMAGVGMGLSTVAGVLGLGPKPPKVSYASTDRLKASLDPRATRKIVFGRTAANTDVHYQEFTGPDQDTLNTILTLASHSLHSIDEIWFDEKVAWSAAGGIGTDFMGYLAVTTRTEGSPANAFTITGSSSWTAGASRMLGLAYVWLRYTLSGDESPFGSNVSSRITVRVRGAKLYDPRRDSTVGGSGSHRATDQTTWAWVDDNVGRNPALQLLWYLLGWRIQNPVTGEWRLAVGLGLPVDRIDLASFIAAANLCDEPVTLASGATEPRYRSDGVFGEGDDPSVVFENLCATMNGVLRDAGGKLALEILHNDLGTFIDLSDADVIDGFTWLQTPPIDQSFNIVRGQYVDPSDAGLYQPVDYPDVSLPSPDGIDRSKTFNFGMVQSPSQAQRLAKTYLQRAQYPGTFTADFLASAWRCQVGSIVRFTFPALGFNSKLFRVIEHSIKVDGRCPMVLREEHASIYAWSAGEAPAVVAAAPMSYNPLNDPIRASLADALAMASSSGKLTIGGPCPPASASTVGDTHVGDDGTFYIRVDDGGILLDGYAVTLDGFRPQLAWTLSPSQPLRETIKQADAAYTDANSALDGLAELADDGILTVNEKVTKLIPDSARLEEKWTTLSGLASSLGVSTTAAAAARISWLAFLGGLSPAWNDTRLETTVSRDAYNGAREGYDAALYELDRAIKNAAASTATWAGVTGAGRPADNATRNVVTYSGTAPASPVDGDLWVDTSGTFAVFKLRSGGGWVTGANALSAYNALSGKPIALADINTTESSKLAGIQAGATVGAPSGTPVGSISADDVAGTINSGGGVSSNRVSTTAIQNAAVNGISSAYTAGLATFPAGAWTAIQSLSLTVVGASGSIVLLKAGLALSTVWGSYVYCSLRITRNGVDITGPIPIQPIASDWSGSPQYSTNFLGTYCFNDAPGAGSHTYALEINCSVSTSSGTVAEARYLEAIEVKK